MRDIGDYEMEIRLHNSRSLITKFVATAEEGRVSGVGDILGGLLRNALTVADGDHVPEPYEGH